MATMSDAGLELAGKILLGIAAPEGLVVVLFNDPPVPDATNSFSDYTTTALSGGGPVPLVPASWFDASVPGLGDYTYPVIPFTFGSSALGDTLFGYMVYSGTTNTVLWFDTFEAPRVIPPTGGVLYLNLEFQDLNAA